MRLFGVLFLAMIAANSAGAAEIRVKPWDKEENCTWWLSGDDGKRLRASIGPGDDGLVLSMADPVFLEFSESDRPKVELIFNGDRRRRIAVEGWSSHIGKETAIFGLEFKNSDLRKFAGATRLELRQGARTYFTLPLIGTPSLAELKACKPVHSEHSDSE